MKFHISYQVDDNSTHVSIQLKYLSLLFRSITLRSSSPPRISDFCITGAFLKICGEWWPSRSRDWRRTGIKIIQETSEPTDCRIDRRLTAMQMAIIKRVLSKLKDGKKIWLKGKICHLISFIYVIIKEIDTTFVSGLSNHIHWSSTTWSRLTDRLSVRKVNRIRDLG